MLKYCVNNSNGKIDIVKISQSLGVSEFFTQTTLEILEELESIKFMDVEKIAIIKPFVFDDFKNTEQFNTLKEEFEEIVNFKKTIQSSTEDELHSFIKC